MSFLKEMWLLLIGKETYQERNSRWNREKTEAFIIARDASDEALRQIREKMAAENPGIQWTHANDSIALGIREEQRRKHYNRPTARIFRFFRSLFAVAIIGGSICLFAWKPVLLVIPAALFILIGWAGNSDGWRSKP